MHILKLKKIHISFKDFTTVVSGSHLYPASKHMEDDMANSHDCIHKM